MLATRSVMTFASFICFYCFFSLYCSAQEEPLGDVARRIRATQQATDPGSSKWGGKTIENDDIESPKDPGSELASPGYFGVDFRESRKAAEEGDPKAQTVLGWVYATGKGVARDDAEAVRWFHEAAEHFASSRQLRLTAC